MTCIVLYDYPHLCCFIFICRFCVPFIFLLFTLLSPSLSLSFHFFYFFHDLYCSSHLFFSFITRSIFPSSLPPLNLLLLFLVTPSLHLLPVLSPLLWTRRGESYLDVIARIEPIIMEMERHREPLLIVGHQGKHYCATYIPFSSFSSSRSRGM